MKTLNAQQAIRAERPGAHRVQLMEIICSQPSEKRFYISDRAFKYPYETNYLGFGHGSFGHLPWGHYTIPTTRDFEPLLSQIGSVQKSIDLFQNQPGQELLRFSLRNILSENEKLFSDIINYTFEGAKVQLSWLFLGPDEKISNLANYVGNEHTVRFKGVINQIGNITDEEIEFNALSEAETFDDGLPWTYLRPFLSTFIDPKDINQRLNYVYGSVAKVPCQAFKVSPIICLMEDISSTKTGVVGVSEVDSRFAIADNIQIGIEEIDISAISEVNKTITINARAQGGTDAFEHNQGSLIKSIIPNNYFIIAGHQCKAVSQVYLKATTTRQLIPIEPGNYTINLADTSLISGQTVTSILITADQLKDIQRSGWETINYGNGTDPNLLIDTSQSMADTSKAIDNDQETYAYNNATTPQIMIRPDVPDEQNSLFVQQNWTFKYKFDWNGPPTYEPTLAIKYSNNWNSPGNAVDNNYNTYSVSQEGPTGTYYLRIGPNESGNCYEMTKQQFYFKYEVATFHSGKGRFFYAVCHSNGTLASGESWKELESIDPDFVTYDYIDGADRYRLDLCIMFKVVMQSGWSWVGRVYEVKIRRFYNTPVAQFLLINRAGGGSGYPAGETAPHNLSTGTHTVNYAYDGADVTEKRLAIKFSSNVKLDGKFHVFEVDHQVKLQPPLAGNQAAATLFDIQSMAYALELYADVEGIKDDASGTITGTASKLLENPVHVAKDIILNRLGLSDSYIDDISFDDAETELASHKIRTILNKTGLKTWEIINNLSQESRSNIFFEDNKFKFVYHKDNYGSPLKVFNRNNTHGRIGVYSTPLSSIVNDIIAFYDPDYSIEGDRLADICLGTAQGSDSSSQTKYGVKKPAQPPVFLLLRDSASVASVINFWLLRRRDRRWIFNFTTDWRDGFDLERGDIIAVHPYYFTTQIICKISSITFNPDGTVNIIAEQWDATGYGYIPYGGPTYGG